MSHPPETGHEEKKPLAPASESLKKPPSQSDCGAKRQLRGHVHRGSKAAVKLGILEKMRSLNHSVN